MSGPLATVFTARGVANVAIWKLNVPSTPPVTSGPKLPAATFVHGVVEVRRILVGVEAVQVGGVFDTARQAVLLLDRAQ